MHLKPDGNVNPIAATSAETVKSCESEICDVLSEILGEVLRRFKKYFEIIDILLN